MKAADLYWVKGYPEYPRDCATCWKVQLSFRLLHMAPCPFDSNARLTPIFRSTQHAAQVQAGLQGKRDLDHE